MNRGPRIKLTWINGGNANPKAVENRLAKEADKWDPLALADLGPCQVGPPLEGRHLVSSRSFSICFHGGIYFLSWRPWYLAMSPLCGPTLRRLAANRYPQPSYPKERRKNPPSSVVAQWHPLLELLFVIPAGWAQSPSQSFSEASHNLLASFDGATSHQAI
jgi:hypothetical protein